MEELSKKDIHDPDNHDDVITNLEPDILESEVKWALESITTNKASGGDGIPVELFQILKDDAVKVLYSVCQQNFIPRVTLVQSLTIYQAIHLINCFESSHNFCWRLSHTLGNTKNI